MAARSPTPFHPFWGVFGSAADLPNVAASPTQSSNLQVGDQAYVAGTFYLCTDATLGAAIWSAVGGGGGGAGSLLWEWNGVDVSQFGAPVGYRNDLGTGPDGVPNIAVVAAGYLGKPVLRLSSSGGGSGTLIGGWYYPALFTPPEDCLIEYHVVQFTAGGGCEQHFVVQGTDGPPSRAMVHRRTQGGAGEDLAYVRQDANPTYGILNIQDSLGSSGTVTAANYLRGGYAHRWTQQRQVGANPATWLNQLDTCGGPGAFSKQGAMTSLGANATLGTNFDGVDFDQFGPGIYNAGSNGHVTAYDILYIRVWALPQTFSPG